MVATVPAAQMALVAPTDVQHLAPDPELVPGQVTWVADTLVPSLPDDMMGDQFLQLPLVGGPLDMEPVSHAYGLGVGPGLSDAENRAVTGPWHAEDKGSVQSRRWQATAARDGSYNVDVVPDEAGDTSPQTVTLRHVTGVGQPNSPDARTGYRIQRWRDRYIDRHMWGAEKRPVYLRNAYVSPALPAPPASPASQYTSPYPGGGWSGQWGMGTPDQLVMPQERRTPRPWDESATTDPSSRAVADHGLGSWGL